MCSVRARFSVTTFLPVSSSVRVSMYCLMMPFQYSNGGGIHSRWTENAVNCEWFRNVGGAEGAAELEALVCQHICEWQFNQS